MAMLPSARADGLAAGAGRPARTRVAEGTVIAMVLALAIAGLPGLLAAALAAFAALSVARLAERSLGGTTGDVIGATQVVAEIAVLVTLTALY
jgi:adenosylcobinamide-GDP ribazoletransferase